MRIRARDWILVAAAWGVSLALIYNVCHLLFRCGCTYVWAGAADHCNIHVPNVPHCPWCSHGLGAFAGGLVPLLGVEALALVRLRRRPVGIRLLAAVIGFFAVAALSALAWALVDGYPTVLGWRLPGR